MESYSNNSIFCCVCFRLQSKYNVPVAFYQQHKKICKECDYFIKCTCKDGIYCLECFAKIGTKCSVCRTVIQQQQIQIQNNNDLNDSMLSNLSELAAETAGSIRIQFNRQSDLNPVIFVSFDNWYSEEPGYEFEYILSFTISEELYAILQDEQSANLYAQAFRHGINNIAGFNEEELQEYDADENGWLPLGLLIEGFFAIEMRETLTNLIYDFQNNEDGMHAHLQNGGVLQAALNDWFEYCIVPFYHNGQEASIDHNSGANNINRFSARIRNTGINQYSLNIHLGNINAPQRNLREFELNDFSARPENNQNEEEHKEESEDDNQNEDDDQNEEHYEYYFQTVSVVLDQQEQWFEVEFDFFDQGYSMMVPYEIHLTQGVIDGLSQQLSQQIMQLPRAASDEQWIANAQAGNYQTVFLQYIQLRIRELITATMERYPNEDDFYVSMENEAFTEQVQQRTLLEEFLTIANPLYVYIRMTVSTADEYPLMIYIQLNETDVQYVQNYNF